MEKGGKVIFYPFQLEKERDANWLTEKVGKWNSSTSKQEKGDEVRRNKKVKVMFGGSESLCLSVFFFFILPFQIYFFSNERTKNESKGNERSNDNHIISYSTRLSPADFLFLTWFLGERQTFSSSSSSSSFHRLILRLILFLNTHKIYITFDIMMMVI